jgi:F-type H+-transporting ATPase subunit b
MNNSRGALRGERMMKRILMIVALCGGIPALVAPVPRAFAADPPHAAAAADEHGTTSDAHATGEHAKAPLLPGSAEEFNQYFLPPAIWTIVIFVILLAILYPTAWKQVLAGLKQREERIRADIANAEESRRKAETTLREYNTQLAAAESRVREMLANATVEGEKLATNIRMKAQQEAEEAKERAQREIEASKVAAIRELHAQAADLATSVAEKILRRNLNADDQQELVRRSLEELQTVGKG